MDKIIIKGKRREDIFATMGTIAIELSLEELIKQLTKEEAGILYRLTLEKILDLTQNINEKIFSQSLSPRDKIEELKFAFLNGDWEMARKINEIIRAINTTNNPMLKSED